MIRRRARETLKGSECGFTLMEAVLALMITGLILGVIYVSFRNVSANTARDDARLERVQVARAMLDRLTLEISSAISMTNADGEMFFLGEKDLSDEEDRDTLQFVTVATPDARPRLIRYAYDEERACYTRANLPPWTMDENLRVEKAPILDPLITGMTVRYFDDEEWVEKWNADESLPPAAIEVTIWIGDPEERRDRAETRILLP